MQKRATVAQQTREQMTQVGKTCLLMVMAALAIALDMCIWFFSVPRRALVHLAMWLNEDQGGTQRYTKVFCACVVHINHAP